MAETVLYEKQGKIVTITLNRPAALNSINRQLRRELGEAIQQFDGEEDSYVAIITGAGRAFCAGRDLKERAADNEAGVQAKAEARARGGAPGSPKDSPKDQETIGKTMFCDIGNPIPQNLIKPVVYAWFPCHFLKKEVKSLQNHYVYKHPVTHNRHAQKPYYSLVKFTFS